MALGDYVICCVCHKKLIYDGYHTIRDRLEELMGDPDADDWTVRAFCPECSNDGTIKIMRGSDADEHKRSEASVGDNGSLNRR